MIDPARPEFTNTPAAPQRPGFSYLPANPSARPLVTIVTPFFNTGQEFIETAHSVLGQSFQQWEWLIVNDGSTDSDSLALLGKYRDRDRRIRVLDHKKNKGLSAARNTGFRAAQCEYVVLLDSDDLLEATATEKWLWFLQSHPEYGFVKGYTVGFGAQQYLWKNGFHNGSGFLDENLVAATCMVRRSVFKATGGFDEVTRGGLEDWDFWLHCAHKGFWGSTIPEYLDWYRRRVNHVDRWANLSEQRRLDFREELRIRYPGLWKNGFPQIQLRHHLPNDTVPDVRPCENRLRKKKPRLLMVLPWLTMGGADKFNLDLLEGLSRRGWEITIATTLRGDHPWLAEFARHTPDVFVMHHFLRMVDYPRFLRFLIESRQMDHVLISNSELGYMLLPYLRAHAPRTTFTDFCHMEEEHWKNGGHPRASVDYHGLLDLSVVSSRHLKKWMVDRGSEPKRIEVCYTNVNADEWKPDAKRRRAVRAELEWDSRRPMILYAGRMVAQKQPRVFAQVMLNLARAGLSFGAIIAGNGPDLPWLKTFVERNSLGKHIRFMGALSNAEMRRLMTAGDIFFLPSQWEGIALAIYEAMAAGLAIVGADVGGQRELVTADCGILVQRGDEAAETERYTEILTGLIKHPRQRSAMGRAAHARVVSHFRLGKMTSRMVKLLEKAALNRKETPRPKVAFGLGRTSAGQAIEYTRLFELAEHLWAKCHQQPVEELLANGSKTIEDAGTPPELQRHMSPKDYRELRDRILATVKHHIPRRSKVLVVSKGDEPLVKLPGRQGWHFPQDDTGRYAGYHPSDGVTAIKHLEELRAKGARYLLLPITVAWWLEHYAEFRQHLDGRYRRIHNDECCIIYRLS